MRSGCDHDACCVERLALYTLPVWLWQYVLPAWRERQYHVGVCFWCNTLRRKAANPRSMGHLNRCICHARPAGPCLRQTLCRFDKRLVLLRRRVVQPV